MLANTILTTKTTHQCDNIMMTTNAVSIVIVMIIITVMSDVVDRAMYFYEHFELRAGTNQSLQSQGDDEEEVEEENELLGV